MTSEKPKKEANAITRRDFVEQTALAGIAAMALGQPLAAGSVVKSGKGSDEMGGGIKILDYNKRTDLPHGGTEVQLVAEVEKTDGTKIVVRGFVQMFETDDAYVMFAHNAQEPGEPLTVIVNGQKGPLEEDGRRLDQRETVIISARGDVSRFPRRAAKVFVGNPYEGLSPNEMAQAFTRDKAAGRFDN